MRLAGTSTRAASFGVFVELAPGVEGLCHNSEIPPEMRKQSPPLPIGQEMTFRILKLNEAEKRIGLSVVTAEAAQELERLGDYQRQAAEATQHIEEALHGPRPGAQEEPSTGEPSREERKQDDES